MYIKEKVYGCREAYVIKNTRSILPIEKGLYNKLNQLF